jgi:hypothetical protein
MLGLFKSPVCIVLQHRHVFLAHWPGGALPVDLAPACLGCWLLLL